MRYYKGSRVERMKTNIIQKLGQTEILLPSLVADGLAANDRVKARLSVLQAAERHARDPQGSRFDLSEECHAACIDPIPMEALVNGSAIIAGERIAAAGLSRLETAIWDDVEVMIHAVKAGDAAEGDAALQRLSIVRGAASLKVSDTVEQSHIARLTGIAGGNGDSLHRLVMDLHRILNRLSAGLAEEVLDGAHVYGLTPNDKSAVKAFMRGVESTHKLKFDHRSLPPPAPAAGARLTIQNDIGETDAHVVVIAVEDSAVTITYTDVHPARAMFFTGLFPDFQVQWSGLDRKRAERLGDDNTFYLITGRFTAADDTARNAFLETIGASLVFLIDWNKARKVLRSCVSKGDAVPNLDWAARHRFGHRGFLELGGSELVASAVHHATPTRIGFGERLDRALGREAAVDFLKTVLRVSAEALLEGGSVRLARDRIEADLSRPPPGGEAMLLAIIVRQAGLAREVAAGIAHFIAERRAHRPFDCAALALRARRIEEKADKIAAEARSEVARFDADPAIEQLVNQIEETIDELEQAAFVASLVPGEIAPELLAPLDAPSPAAVSGCEAAAMGAAATADVPDGQRVDSEDALAAGARLTAGEEQGDAAERAITAVLLSGVFDLKTTLSVLELARAIERATDQLAGFAHLWRPRVLADLST